MEAISFIEGTCVPLPRSDVDTDQIIPSEWLKRVERTGFEKGLFSEWKDDPDFVLNNEAYAGASILVTGPNFGTGSSREHAVWALQQSGFKAVVSSKFGDIFKNNSTKCGLVPVEVSQGFIDSLMTTVEADPTTPVAIDLEKLEITVAGIDGGVQSESFHLNPTTQERLIGGLDDISLSLMEQDKIEDYEVKRPVWL